MPQDEFDALAASSNKCIEGVPGLGFVICREAALAETKGNATTLVLDLHDQWQASPGPGNTASRRRSMSSSRSTRRWRSIWAEGGQPGRGGRYARTAGS